MNRQLSRESVPSTAVAAPPGVGQRGRRWLRGWAIQVALATLLLGFLGAAGGRLVTPPGLFEKAIQVLEASSADLARYDLGVGVSLPLRAPGFVGLEQVAERVWSAAGLGDVRPQVTADQGADLLHLSWTAEQGSQAWRAVVLREEGASSAFAWLRASGTSYQGLERQAGLLLDAARRLSVASRGYLYVRLEGRYDESMGPAAREAMAVSLARVAGEDGALRVAVAAGPGGARLVIETAGPLRAELPLPTYTQVR